MKINKNFFLLLFSIVISFILVEFFFFFKYFDINKNYKFSLHDKRYMLFEEGLVFKNFDKIFKYHPNQKILSKTYYNLNNKWFKEYDYEMITNNFGLVQNNDLKKNMPSILFLGDSFVEGQGSLSWINKFGGKFKNFQLINGGIMGTGPQQFELLENHISQHYKVDKLIFFYIGDDLRRNIFNISNRSLECLKNHKDCEGNESYYGFPLKSKDPEKFLNKLKNYRSMQNELIPVTEKIKNNIKRFFSSFYSIKIINNFLRQKFYFSKNEYIQKNFKSIENLYKKYGDSLVFIQLTNKNEVIHGKEYDTFFAEKFIKKFTKKHFLCDFGNNIENFYKIDMHPNQSGYDHLFNCVKKILQSEI